METMNGVPVRLNIPFYRQNWEFTCGPASLMMAMKYFDEDLQLSRDLEIDLWREGNLVELPGTSRFGLAFSTSVRGFRVTVTSNTGEIDYVNRLIPRPVNIDLQVLGEQFEERKARCRKFGVQEKIEQITGETIRGALLQNHVPVIVTTTPGDAGEHLPHWVVVTGIDNERMYVNDPLDAVPGGKTPGLPELPVFIGYRGSQSMVEIWRE